jgi:MYXO-CTERM domain-containing protein
MPLRTLAQSCRRLSPLLAAPAALLLNQGQAKAVLNFNIFQSGADVVIQGSGSINLTGATAGPTVNCLSSGGPTNSGGIFSSIAALSSGNPTTTDCTPYQLQITTTSFGTGPNSPTFTSTALSTGAYRVAVFGNPSQFGAPFFVIGPNYLSDSPISVSTRLVGVSLAQLAFSPTSGLIGTWSLIGSGDTITASIIDEPVASTPAPLPLLGAGAAFGWSRRLRKRITAPLSTPPQA